MADADSVCHLLVTAADENVDKGKAYMDVHHELYGSYIMLRQEYHTMHDGIKCCSEVWQETSIAQVVARTGIGRSIAQVL